MTPGPAGGRSFAGVFGRPAYALRSVETVATDRRSGAGELAARALGFLASAAPAAGTTLAAYVDGLWAYANVLVDARPAMAPVANAVCAAVFAARAERKRWRVPADVAMAFRRCAASQRQRLADARRDAAAHYARRPLRKPIVISYSSAVLAALEAAPARRVTVCESRPGLEGRRTARRLASLGGCVVFVTESQVFDAVRNCDGVLLGCDAVHPDGSVRNKTGSALLALAARRFDRPVITLGDTYKLSRCAFRALEEGCRGDVWAAAPPSVSVENATFETVPADLVTRLVLEMGTAGPESLRASWRDVQRRRRALSTGPPNRASLAGGDAGRSTTTRQRGSANRRRGPK